MNLKVSIILMISLFITTGLAQNNSENFDQNKFTASITAAPTKLAIISINVGQSAFTGFPFYVIVQSHDDNNIPQNVTQNTDISLSFTTGKGILLGNLTETILAGTNNVIIPAVVYYTSLTPQYLYSISVPEPSGLTFNPSENTLYTVSDGSVGLIYQLSLTGNIIRSLNVNSDDMEGITIQAPYDTLFVGEEKLREIVKNNLSSVRLGTTSINVEGPDNDGLKGISINSVNNNFYVIKQKNPRLLIELNRNGIEIKRTEITYVADLSDICYDSSTNVLWLLSAESRMLCKITLDGVSINKWKLPVLKPEGITVVNDHDIHITCDWESKIYVFKRP